MAYFSYSPSQTLRSPLNKGGNFLLIFRHGLWALLGLAFLCQTVIFFSPTNLVASICVLLAWRLTELTLLNPANLAQYSLSTLIIFGFSLTQFCLPIIFTLIEGKPLIFNLDLPYHVFFHAFLALLVLLLTHILYRILRKQGGALFPAIQRLLIRFDGFTPPSNKQIWIFGWIGIIGMMATYFTDSRHAVTDAERGGMAKIFQSLMPFACAPYFLPLRNLFDHKNTKGFNQFGKLILFTGLLILVGVAGNQRSLFMTGITTAGIAYFIGLLLGKYDYRKITIKMVGFGLLGVWLLVGPLNNIGTAMVIVRDQRSDLSGVELLEKTFEAFQDERAIADYKSFTSKKTTDWDEHYFDNIFLARFCNLKFNDEGLKQSERIGKIDRKMQEHSINRIWVAFPLPIINMIGVDVDKEEMIRGSIGDNLFDRAGGVYAIGGFRVGQFASTGMAAFGWWYLLVLAAGMIPMNYAFDVFVLYKKNTSKGEGFQIISLIGLLPITATFMFWSLSSYSESVINILPFLIRIWPQTIFLYIIIFFISKKISGLFSVQKISKL